MSEERTTLEIIAPTVEEAIGKGLADLGLPEEAVDIEVLDTGSRGLFGLGSRQARIRLTLKSQVEIGTGSQAQEAVSAREETPRASRAPVTEVQEREEAEEAEEAEE